MRALVVQNIDIEGPGLLQPTMEEAGWELDIRVMDQPGAVLPGTLEGYEALLILGGPMNVYEEESYPYLKQVDQLIIEAVRQDMPTLGICLGGQLMAKALGAPVTRNPVQEIGWYRLRLTPAGQKSPLFAGLPGEFPVFQWHGDTFALPAGATRLATGDDCTNQAFSCGRGIFALQFHLEVTPEIIRTWAQAYGDELAEFGGAGAAERLVEQTAALWDEYRQVAGKFLSNWIDILKGRR
ncbi:MAG TPA: type 1 glutamine amidotransferase [Desulfotomaculum sp.]|nr:type 1 glutamine amidotransferase [Desulfotomaculum sp.]